ITSRSSLLAIKTSRSPNRSTMARSMTTTALSTLAGDLTGAASSTWWLRPRSSPKGSARSTNRETSVSPRNRSSTNSRRTDSSCRVPDILRSALSPATAAKLRRGTSRPPGWRLRLVQLRDDQVAERIPAPASPAAAQKGRRQRGGPDPHPAARSGRQHHPPPYEPPPPANHPARQGALRRHRLVAREDPHVRGRRCDHRPAASGHPREGDC